jgi:hypothetical protein
MKKERPREKNLMAGISSN